MRVTPIILDSHATKTEHEGVILVTHESKTGSAKKILPNFGFKVNGHVTKRGPT